MWSDWVSNPGPLAHESVTDPECDLVVEKGSTPR